MLDELKGQTGESGATQRLTAVGILNTHRGAKAGVSNILGARAIQQSQDHKEGAVWQNHEGDIATAGDAAQNKKE